jgi:excisionase family DNA binding protein
MSGKEFETGRQDLPRLLYPRDVAQQLGISVKTVHKLVRDGKLGCVQVTRTDRRFTQEQVQHYIESCTIMIPAKIDREPSVRVTSKPTKGGDQRHYRGEEAKDSWASLQEEMSRWT